MNMVTSDEAAITAIVADLKPWRDQWREEQISLAVTKKLKLLRGAAAEALDRDAIIKTRTDARDIKKTIDKLRQQIRRASPELQLRLDPSYRPELRYQLLLVHDECDRAEENSVTHDRADQVKAWCAIIAYSLIQKYSEEEPTSGSSKAPFRNIAGVLYSCLRPGKRETPDLKRACDDRLRAMRAVKEQQLAWKQEQRQKQLDRKRLTDAEWQKEELGWEEKQRQARKHNRDQ